MEWEKIAEKIRDMILGEIKEEFRDFKASVTGELSGFRLAIESMNARMSGIESRMSAIESRQDNIENELRDLRRTIAETRAELKAEIMQNTLRIDETNKRIDETRAELKAEIMQNTMRIDETNKRIDETNKRIDETNKRIDALYIEMSEMRGELKQAISNKEIIQDIIFRIERLETKVTA
jgi:chromosome segregation ATPase